jgi:hypothetical protein
MRSRNGMSDGMLWLSVISVILLGVSGWLGGEMVYARGVAVEPGADALYASPASETTARPASRYALYHGPERRSPTRRPAYFGPERRMATQ